MSSVFTHNQSDNKCNLNSLEQRVIHNIVPWSENIICCRTFQPCQRFSHLPQSHRSLLHILQGHHSVCCCWVLLQGDYILLQLTAESNKMHHKFGVERESSFPAIALTKHEVYAVFLNAGMNFRDNLFLLYWQKRRFSHYCYIYFLQTPGGREQSFILKIIQRY